MMKNKQLWKKDLPIALVWNLLIGLQICFMCSCEKVNEKATIGELSCIEIYAYPYGLHTISAISDVEDFYGLTSSLNYFLVSGERISSSIFDNFEGLIECDKWVFINIQLALLFYFEDGHQMELIVCQHGGVSIDGNMYFDPERNIDNVLSQIERESKTKFEDVLYVGQQRFYKTSPYRYLDYQIESIGRPERVKEMCNSLELEDVQKE